MTCVLYYQLIESPEKYIFGVLFSLLAISSGVGNTIGILVLRQPELKSITNRIVTSLCVIGCFSGYGFLPIMAWNMFDNNSSELCYLVVPRATLSAIMNITTSLNMCVLTYDRYILLTKGASYNKVMNNCKVMIWISISWVTPIVFMAILYTVGDKYSNILTAILSAAPLVAALSLYFLLRVSVHKKERKLDKHAKTVQTNALQTRKTILDSASKQRHVSLAKKMNVLLILVLSVTLPLTGGNVVYYMVLFKYIEDTRILQIYYLSAMFLCNTIAVVHLVFYYRKYPEFNRSFWKWLKIKRLQKDKRTKAEVQQTDLQRIDVACFFEV